MNPITREQRVYLQHRAQIENVTDIRDYQQLIGEHALVMIDMLRAMAQDPVRISAVANIGARAQQNAEELRDLVVEDGVDHVREWADVCVAIGGQVGQRAHEVTLRVIKKANADLIDFMQVGSTRHLKPFLEQQHGGPGRALGHLCALSGRWRKQYDAQQGLYIAARIQNHWSDYVRSLVEFTHVLKSEPTDTRIYHHSTMVLLSAKALGKAWSEWTQ